MHTTPRLTSVSGGTFVRIIVFLVIFFGVLTAAWIFFLPLVLTGTLTKRTGFDVTVQKLVFNPFTAAVELEGLVVSNPNTFPHPDYLKMRSFQARAPLKMFWSKQPDIEYVNLDIERITFVRNQNGTLNSALFYDRLFPPPASAEPAAIPKPGEPRRPTATPAPPTERRTPKQVDFRIQQLSLRLDTVVTEDHSRGPQPPREFQVNLNQVYRDVTDPKQLMTPAMVRALSPVATAINGLIPGSLGDVLNSAVETPPSGKKKTAAPDVLKSISDTLEETKKP